MKDLGNWALKKINEADTVLAVIFTVILVLLVTFLILAGVVWVTMWIWNAVMPVIFGLPEITFWQTMGLWWICSFFVKPSMSSKEEKK